MMGGPPGVAAVKLYEQNWTPEVPPEAFVQVTLGGMKIMYVVLLSGLGSLLALI